ncbi:MAG: hypothetical protein A2Y10_12280, partial [Planctomycetes bacterium GWF2_41_51]
WGYDVIVAENGSEGWQAIMDEMPDITVLDWMMPGLDGVSLCRSIRNMKNLPYIYIIILTAKCRNQEILVGFDAGADDYIVKPFDRDILYSRIAVGSRVVTYDKELMKKNKQLQQYSSEMKQLAEERSKQLVHAERMATVGLLSAGIAHEINNPTAFISGNVQIIERYWKDIEPKLKSDADNEKSRSEKIDFILEEMPKTIQGMQSGVRRISKIVNSLKNFCRKSQGDLVLCDINICVEQALELCRNALKAHVTVEKKLSDNLPQIKADTQQIEQVLVNLFTNAADAIGANDGIMTIETRTDEEAVIIMVGDTGPGIAENILDSIRQPFFTTKPAGSGTGLGLFIVRGIIENHKGKLKIENKSTGGALFTITLPIFPEGTKNEIENINN